MTGVLIFFYYLFVLTLFGDADGNLRSMGDSMLDVGKILKKKNVLERIIDSVHTQCGYIVSFTYSVYAYNVISVENSRRIPCVFPSERSSKNVKNEILICKTIIRPLYTETYKYGN